MRPGGQVLPAGAKRTIGRRRRAAQEVQVGDRVIRAITIDGSFRVITVRTTALVRAATATQEVTGQDARAFGELLTGAILVRETMSPAHRVQTILSRSERGQMLADAHPDDGTGALTRGLVNRIGNAAMGELLGEGAVLKVIRSLPGGKLHQSIVEANGAQMSQALMVYMQESEQVLSTLLVATVLDGGRVVAAGGYIVQVLPEIQEAPLAVMTERLAHDFASLDRFLLEHDADPRILKDELLYGMPHEDLYEGPVRSGCDCSEARVLSAIATLGRDEVAQIIAQGEVVSLTCEYCRKPWVITAERLKNLLTPS